MDGSWQESNLQSLEIGGSSGASNQTLDLSNVSSGSLSLLPGNAPSREAERLWMSANPRDQHTIETSTRKAVIRTEHYIQLIASTAIP